MHQDGDIILDCVINKGIVEFVTDDISHVSRSIDEVLPETVKFWSNDSVREGLLFYAESLRADQIIEGPAIIVDQSTTIVVDHGGNPEFWPQVN